MFSINRKAIQSKQAEQRCENCNNEIILQSQWEYIETLFIPFFPLGKMVKSKCQHCKQLLDFEEMPSDLKFEANKLKSQSVIPLWSYLGIIITPLAIIIVSFFAVQFTRDSMHLSQEYLESPKLGDVYEIKIDNKEFSLMKVVNTKEDSIYFYQSKYILPSSSSLKEINDEKDFDENEIGYSKVELKKMLDERKILDIIRE